MPEITPKPHGRRLPPRLAAFARIAACFAQIAVAVYVGRRLDQHQAYGYLYWIANGILLAYLLLAPRWRWPHYLTAGVCGMLAGSLAAGDPLRQNLFSNGLNLVEVLVAALLLRRRSGTLLRLTERGHVVRFVVLGVMAGPAAGAMLLGASSALRWHSLGACVEPMLNWLVGDGLGIAVSTPAFLAILSLRPRNHPLRRDWSTAIVLWGFTGISFAQNRFPLLFFLYPLLVPVLVRLGLGFASFSLLISSVIAFSLTLNGAGPFAGLTSTNPMLPALMLEGGIAAAILLLYLVSVLVESRTKAERRLERIANLQQLVTDNSRDGIIVTYFDDSHRYISPSIFSTTGYPQDYFTNHTLYDILHPDDVPKLRAKLAELREGGESALLEWRVRRADGEYVWIEGNICLLRDKDRNKPIGTLYFARDITDRKQAELRLYEAYHIVESQAVTDALTGIANRRRFDQVLAKEWRRATRTQLPLTMLMLDVDLFKLYNDAYGHLRGDNCLRHIAESILEVAGRSEDLVARYGGEEFAVLLPNTSQTGGLTVAEHISKALIRRQLKHSESPYGVVTVSIGCATITPRVGQRATELVEQADRGLYQAKEQGRNRVCTI